LVVLHEAVVDAERRKVPFAVGLGEHAAPVHEAACHDEHRAGNAEARGGGFAGRRSGIQGRTGRFEREHHAPPDAERSGAEIYG
jgi:hypothetical protein